MRTTAEKRYSTGFWQLIVIGVMCVGAVVVVADAGSPVAAATEQKVAVSVAGNGYGACAATDDAEVWCWGAGWNGFLGNGVGGTAAWDPHTAVVPVRSLASGSEVATGCARTDAGAVECWGSTGIIEDGTGSLFTNPPWGSNTPRSYGFGVAAQISGRCARLVSGAVQCQGWDAYGEVGSGGAGWPGSAYPHTPPSAANAENVIGINDAIDLSGLCALRADRTVWCWGQTSGGQLGDGFQGYVTYRCSVNRDDICNDYRYTSTPMKVAGIADVASIHQTCAIKTDGSVWCWGLNPGGRFLTSSSFSVALPPTELPQFAGATSLAVGYQSMCAVLADGQTVCQGDGYLGDGVDHVAGSTADVDQTGHATEVVAIGYDAWCIRYNDGRIDCWGTNSSGQLGLGFTSPGNAPVLTPSPVIGFGGEILEDDLTVDIALDPAVVSADERTPGEPVDVAVTITITNGAADPVTSVSLKSFGLDRVFAGLPLLYTLVDPGPVGPNEIAIVAPPDNISGLALPDIEAESSLVLRAKFRVETPGAFEATASVWAAGYSPTTVVAVGRTPLSIESGLGLELVGVERPTPDVIELLATVKNSTAEEITLDWGTGLSLDVLAGDHPIQLKTGPDPAPPATIAPNAEIEVRWRYDVRSTGVVVAVLAVGGTTAGGASADAVQELSVQITDRDVVAADMQRAAVSGVNDYLGTLSELNEMFDQEAAEQVLTASDRLYEEQFRSYQSLGFSDANAKRLAGMAVSRLAANAYWESFKSSASTRVGEIGGEFVDGTTQFVGFISDSERRNAAASHLVGSLVTNSGYLADSFAIPVGEKATNIWNSWTGAADSTSTALGEAWTGQKELWRIDADLFRTDPIALATNVGGRHGRQAADFGAVVVTEVASEVVTAGAGTAFRAVRQGVGKGVRSLRATVGLAEEGGALALAGGDDALGAAGREFARGEAMAKRFQDLEYGAVIDVDDVARLAGFAPSDSAAIDAMIREVKELYGVDIKVIARTAEPSSVGIANGIGKRSFTKEKAVGELDRLMGAPESLSGRVTIFEPKPLSLDVAEAMEAADPGFMTRFEERFKIQQKNWDAYQAGTSKTRRLAEASELHDGITVLSDLPNNSVEGLEYLEQLLEPDFRSAKGLSDEAAADLYAQLSRHPSATRTNLRLVDVDGAKTLVDVVDGAPRPVISDYDLQAVLPEGDFPLGMRGQIERHVKERMDELGRSGRHGWSTSAFDLPSANFDLAAEYIMKTAHPSVARQTANNLYKRFQALAREFRDKAALELSPARRAELLATAERFEGLTPEVMLAIWPPGEKTIVYTAGRITVGSGTGGTP